VADLSIKLFKRFGFATVSSSETLSDKLSVMKLPFPLSFVHSPVGLYRIAPWWPSFLFFGGVAFLVA
jgi:hypothetical protein